jgi:predicted nucleic acid-binding protein
LGGRVFRDLAFVKYRQAGGTERSLLPDVYLGAPAAIEGLTLLTRDARRYRKSFPTLRIVAP